MDDKKQWFKSKVRLGAKETPIEYAFCFHAIQTPEEVFVAENAKEDERFKNNPLVTGDPNIEFYAGVPILKKTKFLLVLYVLSIRKNRPFQKLKKGL